MTLPIVEQRQAATSQDFASAANLAARQVIITINRLAMPIDVIDRLGVIGPSLIRPTGNGRA
jgi:hypothetical protein